MTSDEIKKSTTMDEVLGMYGLKSSRGMISCPFHGKDRHPSMKIYRDGYKCFACGENGDIFSFVQKMENCGFKEAFKILGGRYEKCSGKERSRKNRELQIAKSERERTEKQEEDFKKMLSLAIDGCRSAEKICEPFSDMWCFAVDNLPELLNDWEQIYINGEEVSKINVLRRVRRVNARLGIG